MTDLERLESEMTVELAAALRLYAAEADTTIDAAATARAIARRHPRRPWLDRLALAIPAPAPALVRGLVILGLLLLGLVIAFAVGRTLDRGAREFAVRGHLDCVETAPGTTSSAGQQLVTDGIRLECQLTTGERSVSGVLSMVLTRTLVDGRNGLELGSATLTASGGTCAGDVRGLVVETGAWSGRITLGCVDGTFRGRVLGLSTITLDGASWAVEGTLGQAR